MKKAILSICFAVSFVGVAYSYGGCDEYGPFAMVWGDSCKCISGYVFDKDILGNTTCVSGNSVCWDKYGYNSEYDSLSTSCKCSYGYIFGKDSIGRTQCVSPDSVCTDKYGYNAKYNSLTDSCECRSGYVLDSERCTDGDTFCRSKLGLYSSYDDLSEQCKCDEDYTIDSTGQCVQKQHNVYFILEDLNINEDEAIIESSYDLRNYQIEYGPGCYSLEEYLDDKIVVNLGTDYDVDFGDKIVLQNNSETCSILSSEWTSESKLHKATVAPSYYSVPSVSYNNFTVNTLKQEKAASVKKQFPPSELSAKTGTSSTPIPSVSSKERVSSSSLATDKKIEEKNIMRKIFVYLKSLFKK